MERTHSGPSLASTPCNFFDPTNMAFPSLFSIELCTMALLSRLPCSEIWPLWVRYSWRISYIYALTCAVAFAWLSDMALIKSSLSY